MYKYISILLLILTLSSCSDTVYEDRKFCPCILTLDLSNVTIQDNSPLHLWVFGEDDKIVLKDTIPKNKFGGDYQIKVNREMTHYYIWSNVNNSSNLNDNLTLESSILKIVNESADSLYNYKNKINTNHEYVRDTVMLTKEFITINIEFAGTQDKEITLEASGDSEGFYIDKQLYPGSGKVVLSKKEEKLSFTFRLLRQKNSSSLEISLFTKIQGLPVSLSKLPIGKYLEEMSYNMNSKNLEDIDILIDQSNNFINITTADWSITKPINIEF